MAKLFSIQDIADITDQDPREVRWHAQCETDGHWAKQNPKLKYPRWCLPPLTPLTGGNGNQKYYFSEEVALFYIQKVLEVQRDDAFKLIQCSNDRLDQIHAQFGWINKTYTPDNERFEREMEV